MNESLHADLVLEGGGVKGIALAGAIAVLEERGYKFHKVAGTSAGSIVGALVAAGSPATSCMRSCGPSITAGSRTRLCSAEWAGLVSPLRLSCTGVGVGATTCIHG